MLCEITAKVLLLKSCHLNDFSHKLNNNYFPSLIIANSEWMKKRTSQYHRFRTHQYLFNTNEYIRILKKEK